MDAGFHAQITGWGSAQNLNELAKYVLIDVENVAIGDLPLSEARVKNMCSIMKRVLLQNEGQLNGDDLPALHNIKHILTYVDAGEGEEVPGKEAVKRIKGEIETVLKALESVHPFPLFPASVFNEVVDFLPGSDIQMLTKFGDNPDIDGVKLSSRFRDRIKNEIPRQRIENMDAKSIGVFAGNFKANIGIEAFRDRFKEFFIYASPQQQAIFFSCICDIFDSDSQQNVMIYGGLIMGLLLSINDMTRLNLMSFRYLAEPDIMAIVNHPLGLESLGLPRGVTDRSIRMLADSLHMSALRELHFDKNLTEEELRVLLTSQSLPKLKKISIASSGITLKRAKEILSEESSDIEIVEKSGRNWFSSK